MKIAFVVIKALPFGGGIEKYTEEVGRRLAARGHEVVVYTMKHYSGIKGLYRGMRVIQVPCLKRRSLEKHSASFTATLHACLRERPDVLHFQHASPAFFSPLALLSGIRFTMQSHRLEWEVSRWNAAGRLLLRLLEYSLAYSPSTLAVVSHEQQKYFKKRYGRDSIYIPTGVNEPERVPPDFIKGYGLQGNDYILSVGRLSREKGLHYLITAFLGLKQDRYKLLLAGEEPNDEGYRKELERLAQGNPDIIFTGYRSGRQLSELFTNCRLFVLPSEIEGLPTVLLEAMSYGACCLVSDIAENTEALAGFGYTFASRDSTSLMSKLTGLLGDEAALSRYRAAASNHVLTTHSWDSITDKFEEMFKDTLAR